ncbi:MAG: hypothetical protein ABEH90_04625 [Halolamina sp.]
MSDSATDDEEGEWQFGLEDVTEGGQKRPAPPPIEPGSPSLEGTVFILLGVALTLYVLFGV